jgi:GTP-binding protein
MIEEAQVERIPRVKGRREARIYYGTQSDVTPPTMVLFVNDPALFPDDYLRYLENRLRRTFEFSEIPIRIRLRRRTKPKP